MTIAVIAPQIIKEKGEVEYMNRVYRILGKRGRVTIPYEIRQRVGFSYNDVLSFEEADDGSSVTVRREKVCDNCRTGVTEKRSNASDTVTLFDFLNELSPEQQRSALVHLSVKLASMQGGVLNG